MTSRAMSLDYSVGGEYPKLVHFPSFFFFGGDFLFASSNPDSYCFFFSFSEGLSQVEEQV